MERSGLGRCDRSVVYGIPPRLSIGAVGNLQLFCILQIKRYAVIFIIHVKFDRTYFALQGVR